MSADQFFVGIDSGTQGTKVVILSRNKRAIVALADAAHELTENKWGGREQEPGWWIAALGQALTKALGHADIDIAQIKAIGVSGQQHGFVPLDRNGKVIRPAKLWCDTETAQACQRLIETAGGSEAVFETIGGQISTGFTASKIYWLQEQEPGNYQRLATILLPHDYLNYWLTGQRKTEFGDASGTGFFDVRKRRWSDTILQAIDPSGRLESCLPELIAPDSPCGVLRPELAKKWGFSKTVLVSAGGGDNMMAAIGTGNVKPGIITASLGTSGALYGFSAKPVCDEQARVAPFCSSTGGWLPLVCTMNVTVATEQVRALLELDLERFNDLVTRSRPGAGGLLLLPYFNGERTPDLPNATANFSGITSLNLSPANLARASMEGATLGLRYGLAAMYENGIRAHEIRLVGGGAKSPVWRQMVSDIFNMEVVTPMVSEAGALGGALQAMWCYVNHYESNVSIEDLCEDFVHIRKADHCRPDPQTSKEYEAIFTRYLDVDKKLRPLNESTNIPTGNHGDTRFV